MASGIPAVETSIFGMFSARAVSYTQQPPGIDGSELGSKVDISVWLFFQITANNVCLPILVATFLFAKNVRRHPTLINMCVTWIVAGVSACLL